MSPARGLAPILRPDHEPPDWEALRGEIARVHAPGRAVAIYAVTRESLVVAHGVLAEVGALPGDRIEHAAVVGADAIGLLVGSGAVVVTQPGLVVERAPEYRQDVPEGEHADLYRYASLLKAGVRVMPSSDAPFASEDPWRTIAAAATGELGLAERLPPARALAGYLTPLADPGGAPRRVEPGVQADLCLLRVPLTEALAAPDSGVVAVTMCRGRVVFPDA